MFIFPRLAMPTCQCSLRSLLRGGPVEDAIGHGPNDGRFPMEAIKPFARAVITAVAALHDSGIAHCDLKPENLVLRRAGDLSSVVVIDLGCARQNGAMPLRLHPEHDPGA